MGDYDIASLFSGMEHWGPLWENGTMGHSIARHYSQCTATLASFPGLPPFFNCSSVCVQYNTVYTLHCVKNDCIVLRTIALC